MSDRTPDEKLRELVGLFEAMDEGGAPPPLLGVLVGETHTALTELLALRAEVERLRAVEQAHHKNYALCTRCYGLGITTLPDGKHGQVCPLCSGCGYIVHRTALDANKREPEKP